MGVKTVSGYCGIGLYNPIDLKNVGAALRAAHVYSASFVAISGMPYKKQATDTTKGFRHFPLFSTNDLKSIIPYDCVPVAVDLIDGAKSMVGYKHPKRAFYIFGPENGTLGKEFTEFYRDIVYIPTKHCMNLAATVNVVLYDRMAKELKL
jgi:tRNA(Leu) C34 or U34 (ribose-2'-O)-methylase TrmL